MAAERRGAAATTAAAAPPPRSAPLPAPGCRPAPARPGAGSGARGTRLCEGARGEAGTAPPGRCSDAQLPFLKHGLDFEVEAVPLDVSVSAAGVTWTKL